MDATTKIEVTNRNNGATGYDIPELRVSRQFAPGETKKITFEELEQLSYIPGGKYILSDLLKIDNEEVVKELLGKVEPEYTYNLEDIKRILTTGSLDELLDTLDFAPASVVEQIKEWAVKLPITDLNKMTAIKEKTSFDVQRAIEINNTKYDGDNEAPAVEGKHRRVATPESKPKVQRRVID